MSSTDETKGSSGVSTSDEEEEEEYCESESNSQSESTSSSHSSVSANKKGARSRRRTYAEQKVDYKEESDASEDDEEAEEVAPVDELLVGGPHTDQIEKVLSHRHGVPSATGPDTTWYNIEDKGDPNANVDEYDKDKLERQYLIKWFGWSHFHNTWESLNSIEASGAKGIRKVENYIKRQSHVENWCQLADKEYIELYNCELELNEELIEQYKVVERIIAHQEKNSGEYLVKWKGLPYSECTWEDEALIRRRFMEKIKEFEDRLCSETIPQKNYSAYRKRPRFQKLEHIPDFLQTFDEGTELELRDYQLEGLNWLLHSWSRNNSCILADEMGLGKTIQAISFISSLFHIHELYGPFLVVAPLSTMPSWQQEFDIWGKDLNVIMYLGDASSRDMIRQYEIEDGRYCRTNVIITTYELILKDKLFLGKFKWSCLVVDEAHRLKNDDSLLYQVLTSFSTNHRLLITGTPLQNSLRELWALLHFIMPDNSKMLQIATNITSDSSLFATYFDASKTDLDRDLEANKHAKFAIINYLQKFHLLKSESNCK